MSPRSCTKRSEQITPASPTCVAESATGRLCTTVDHEAAEGARRVPADQRRRRRTRARPCAFEPVSTLAQMPSTMIIAQSPNIDRVCPASRRRRSRRWSRSAHQAARKTRKSPLIVLPRDDKRRAFGRPAAARLAASGDPRTSGLRTPSLPSTSRLVPAATPTVDVARDALHGDGSFAHGVEAHVARDRLHLDGSFDAAPVVKVSETDCPCTAPPTLPEAHVAADGLDVRVALGISPGDDEVARGRLRIQRRIAAAELRVGGRRLDRGRACRAETFAFTCSSVLPN